MARSWPSTASTKQGTTLVRLALLDADVVIRLFELDLWDKLVAVTRINLAQEVYDQALHYYDPDTMARKRIDLDSYRDRGMIDVPACDAAEAARIRLKCWGFAEVHGGELESLTLMCQSSRDALFCTADGGAIRAAVILDLAEKLVSLEELLRRVGLQRKFEGDLWQLSEDRFQQVLRRANIDKIQGFGQDTQP